MPAVYHTDIVQGSDEWHAIRAGKFSASKGAVIMGGLDTSGLASYLKDLAWERVYGPSEAGFKSKAMERGNLVEPDARSWYAFDRDLIVEEVGFVDHGEIPNFGWSPDGLHSKRKGAIEAKCPLHKAWMEVKHKGKVPAEYRWQCRIAQTVGRLDSMDFVAFHPQAGGLVVPCEITEGERDQIAARISTLEPKVQAWVDIITDRKEAA